MLNHRIPRPCSTIAVIAATALMALVCVPPAALAHGGGGVSVSCTDNPAACDLSAHAPGNGGPGTSGSQHAGRGGTGTGATGSGATGQSGTQAAGGYGGVPPMVCTDVPFLPLPADLASLGLRQPSGPGHWVLQTCVTTLGATLILPIPMWVPNGAPALPDPRVLAAQALAKLALPTPDIDSSPGGGVPQSVQLPTWAWLPSNQWAPRSATASVPGESVTATATPHSVTWTWGDGTNTVCHGPGTPYVKGLSDPAAASPDCGHTYRRTSAQVPGQQFPVTATLAFSVAWSGGGQSGTFPDLTTTATAHWTVRQIQSLTVNK